MNNSPDTIIKRQLTTGHAHASFDDVIANISLEHLGIKPNNLPYSIWMLVEHIRITQWDILDFSRNPNYQELKWPEEYWPAKQAPANESEWKTSLQLIKKDRDDFIALLNEPSADLYTPFAHGEGQTLLREALLIADQTSYHLGQIIVIRRLLNDWKC